MDEADIIAELERDRPVIARIGWPDEAGHVVIICGAAKLRGFVLVDTAYFDIYDPYNRKLSMNKDFFTSVYKSRGKWPTLI
jgi:hypothetical protein